MDVIYLRLQSVFLVVGVAVVSGCIGPEPSAEATAHHAFIAQLDTARGDVRLELQDAVEVSLRDGTIGQGYPLLVERAGTSYTYFLDGAMRVVAYEYPCHPQDGMCSEYHTRLYMRAGAVAPYGVGLTGLVEDGAVIGYDSWPAATVPADVDARDGKTVVTLPADPEELPEWWDNFVRGALTYAEGRMVPSSAQIRIVDYERGAELSPIPVLEFALPEPTAGDHAGVFYPGSGGDWNDKGIADDEFLHAIQSDPEVRALWDGGCLRKFWGDLPADDNGALKDPTAGQTFSATIELIGADGALYATTLEVHHPLVGEPRYSTTSPTLVAAESNISCDDLDDEPPPRYNLSWALKTWRAQGESEVPHSFLYHRGGTSTAERDPSEGISSVTWLMRPDFVQTSGEGSTVDRYALYYYEVNLHHGWTEAWRGHPSWSLAG